MLNFNSGARGETRTLTPAKAADFESAASTIPPLGHCIMIYASVLYLHLSKFAKKYKRFKVFIQDQAKSQYQHGVLRYKRISS